MITGKSTVLSLALAALTTFAAVPVVLAQEATPKSSSEAAPKQKPVAEKFGDWSVVCIKDQENVQRCVNEMMLVTGKKKDKPVLIWRWRYDKDLKLKIDLGVATGLRVDKPITVAFNDAEPTSLPYEYCTPAMCGATFPVEEAQLKAALTAADVKVTVVPMQGKPVDFKVSMKGLTDSLKALKAKNGN